VRSDVRRRVPFAWVIGPLAVLLVAVLIVRWAGGDAGPGAAATRSSPSTSPSPSPTPQRPPACTDGKTLAAARTYGDWSKTLVDTRFRLPATYVPPDLVPVSQAGLSGTVEVRSLVIPDLTALGAAAAAAGAPVDVEAAYRSWADQQSLYERRLQEFGPTGPATRTARPGHSEHQLGTTVDFKTKGALDVSTKWASSRAGAWMQANAWRFGFVLSYPSGQDALTCYPYEPWHFRYFGRVVASIIHASGLTSRQVLWDEERTASP